MYEGMSFAGWEIESLQRTLCHPMVYVVLYELQKHGIVCYEHDDGEGVTVHKELAKIASSLEIAILSDERYSITLRHPDHIPHIIK